MKGLRGLKKYLIHKFDYTKVYALVGESGSGKSYNAYKVVNKYNIDVIIDDGIMIRDGRVIAGMSSKEEKNEMFAVRRAVFRDRENADVIRRVLARQGSVRILILGTSDKMVQMICENLSLPHVYKIIRIEDISSEDDIMFAHSIRDNSKGHIIPLSYFEINRYLSERNIANISLNDNILDNRTQVSPQFGKKNVFFSENQIKNMINEALTIFLPDFRVAFIYINNSDDKQYISVSVKNVFSYTNSFDKVLLRWQLSDYLKKKYDYLIMDKIL